MIEVNIQKDEIANEDEKEESRQLQFDRKIKKVGIYKVGMPLVNNGSCKHYRSSFRYFRFPCCGKAYPCDICHDENENGHFNSMAKNMLCGFCSFEQACKEICLRCNSNVCSSGSGKAFWEGGKGLRNK